MTNRITELEHSTEPTFTIHVVTCCLFFCNILKIITKKFVYIKISRIFTP